MATTRPRVNLTLTEMEQRFLEEIVTEGTTEYEIYVDYLRRSGLTGEASPPALADVVHVLLNLGLERLHEEAAEISYAAEAAAATDADRAVTAYLQPEPRSPAPHGMTNEPLIRAVARAGLPRRCPRGRARTTGWWSATISATLA